MYDFIIIGGGILGMSTAMQLQRTYPDSRMLLRAAYQSVQAAGWQAVNVDTTIIAQAPKLAPHIAAMRANIAADLGLPLQSVNIKGKTNEKLGYLGRQEGIEAQAAVLLQAV